VDLVRGLSLGTVGASSVIDVAYLAVMGLAGFTVATRRLQRLLLR
jgi:hypothetical protein